MKIKTHMVSKLKNPFFELLIIISLITGLFVVSPSHAHAEAENNVQVSLISSHQKIVPGDTFYLALKLEHAEGWHTYWINPGDSGQELRLEWQSSPAINTVEIQWPTPKAIPTPPLTTYGYEDTVYLPMRSTLPKDFMQKTITFEASARWLECKDVCLPAQKNLSLTMDVGQEALTHPIYFAKIENTLLNLVPQLSENWQSTAIYGDKALQISFSPQEKNPFNAKNIRFIPYQTGVINNSAEQLVDYNAHINTYTLSVERNDFKKNAPNPLKGIVIYNKNQSVEINPQANVGTISSTSTAPQNIGLGFLVALGFAFIGGLILNLMPCVLPVLAIKITHLVTHAQKDAPWQHGLAFALGVISTFLVLAGALIALQAGGQALGWGFQLQNPIFVLIISIILMGVALDLMGVFEIGAGLTRLGGKGEKVDGKSGSFLIGVLATIVATPCTAPFMGSAMAFTLGKPAFIILTIFAMLGVGLATPYVLLTIFPRLLSFIPKPGPWMETFKQILAFPILATILWLVWVLGGQVGSDGMLLGLMVLLMVAFGLWLWGRFGQSLAISKKKSLIILVISLGIVLSAVFAGITGLNTLENAYNKNNSGSASQRTVFRPGLAEERQKNGLASFVIFTADWCITCKVNEKTVLNSSAVQQAFRKNNIEVLVADWTSRDDMIGNTLKKHGRAGVPFYLYYPPQKGIAPKPLPELLTKDIVLRMINRE